MKNHTDEIFKLKRRTKALLEEHHGEIIRTKWIIEKDKKIIISASHKPFKIGKNFKLKSGIIH